MPKPKAVNVRLIPEKNEDGTPHKLYAMMNEIIVTSHEHLKDARIALAFNLGWKADVDGRLVLGKCRKCSDLDREFKDYDFVILLNLGAMKEMSEEFRRALIDHELTHANVQLDKYGEPKTDERGRTLWRIRKHDIEEFAEIVSRHGIYKSDIAMFVAAAIKSKKTPLLQDAQA